MTYSLNTLNNDRRTSGADDDAKPTGFKRFAQEIALTAGFVFMAFWFLALITHTGQDPAWTTLAQAHPCVTLGVVWARG